jgi:Heparinase II/III N-terminus/Heparinase II/III-like protein
VVDLSRSRVVRALALLGLAGVVVLAGLAITGNLRNPFRQPRVPPFLDTGSPVVQAARSGARTQRDLLENLRDDIKAAMPSMDGLWTTQVDFGREPAVSQWIESRTVTFRSFPGYAPPTDPAWSENPHADLAWQTDYQSLGWLRAPAAAFIATGDEAYREDVRAYLLDWIADASLEEPPSIRTWYDHAVAYRVDVIVELLATPVLDALSTDELWTVLTSLRQHARLLDAYLEDPAFEGHNHNVFHAMSLYSLAQAIPLLRGAERWRERARERITTLVPEMVGADGASLEQAASYHYLALRLFARADELLRRHGDGLPDDSRALLSRMTEFGALLITPTGTMPAIGDTNYGSATAESALADVAARGLDSELSTFVRSRGTAGSRPPDVVHYPDAGYVIARPRYSPGSGWSRDLHLVVDTTGQTQEHGHDDALNVILSAGGGPLLVDPGGPYVYGAPRHRAFVRRAAHNVVVDADASGRAGAVVDLRVLDDASRTLISGRHALGQDSEVQRWILLLKSGTVIIIDRARTTSEIAHAWTLRYHLPPGAIVTAIEDDPLAGVVAAGPAGMGYRLLTGATTASEVITGRESPLDGWVTPRYGALEPAPALSFEQEAADAWFVMVIRPGAIGLVVPPGAEAVVVNEALDVHLDDGTHIAIDTDGRLDVDLP